MINLLETDRIKEEIDKNPQNFQAIIEDTFLCICITDEDQTFFAVNDNYCTAYGYSREELIGKNFLLVVPEPKKEELSNLHDKFIELQVEMFRTWEVRKKNGEIFKISVDAGYTEKITGRPQKLTFVQPE